MLVCHCAAVNERRVREAIAAGAHDLLSVADACGAGSFCGSCVPIVADLVAEATGESAAALAETAPTTASDGAVPLRKPLAALVRELHEDIATARWPIGDRLGTEEEVATRYRVTRGALREAVTVLGHHGVLRRDEDGGEELVVGRPLGSAIAEAAAIHLHGAGVGLEDLTETRCALELVSVRRAARRSDPEAVAALEQLEAGPSDDPAAVAQQHIDFHVAVARSAGSPAFGILVETLVRVTRGQAAALEHAEQSEGQTAHRAITAALRAGDEEAAARAMRQHLDAVHEFFSTVRRKRPAAAWVAPSDDDPIPALARLVADDVHRRGLQPGHELGSAAQLAARYGVDRSVLRDAAPLLEFYSVAQKRSGPGGGFVVAALDRWPTAQLMALYLDFVGVTTQDIFEARHVLEMRSVELASHRIDDEQAQRLRRRLDEELNARSSERLGYGGRHNVHAMIGELSGSPVLALFTSALTLALMRNVSRVEVGPDRAARINAMISEAHKGIVEAIVARDPDLACERMAIHLEAHSDLSAIA